MGTKRSTLKKRSFVASGLTQAPPDHLPHYSNQVTCWHGSTRSSGSPKASALAVASALLLSAWLQLARAHARCHEPQAASQAAASQPEAVGQGHGDVP